MARQKTFGLTQGGAWKRLFVIAIVIVLAIAGLAFVTARTEAPSQARPIVAADGTSAEYGAAAFVGAGFGGISQDALETNAIPWKLTAAALVLAEVRSDPTAPVDHDTLRKVMQRFGFLYPDEVAGFGPQFPSQLAEKPLGMTHGTIAPIGGARVEVANLGCAACHSGVAYDASGNPQTEKAYPGTPNTSLDLEGYTQAIFVALRDHIDDPALVETAQKLFPDMGWRERISLRWIVLPLARDRLAQLEGEARALPFSNGLPGSTNGVAALKLQLATPLMGAGSDDRGFVSIPELALRNRRSRLLVDGVYAVPSGDADQQQLAAITSFFTVPSMGVHPASARRQIGDAQAIFAWLADYRAPRFPGTINQARARSGLTIFNAQCAQCHGDYEWGEGDQPSLVTFPDWVGDVGSDGLRAAAFDEALARAVEQTNYSDVIALERGDGYAAPPLAGLWYSAPYLHNGSVQSLSALLDPSLRLERFMVGGHALDLEALGIRLLPDGRYPEGYVPFSRPQWIETSEPGLGNQGHAFGSELSDDERAALIEFLKTL